MEVSNGEDEEVLSMSPKGSGYVPCWEEDWWSLAFAWA
jgi:hypothetical protein